MIQRHRTLPPAKVIVNAPAKRPWFGYPYAIVGAAQFNAQAALHGVGGGDEFLSGANAATANIVPHPGGLSLRLSNNADMAIEESNLTARQPKEFYATAALVQASNQALAAAHSPITLHTDGTSITIWTGWSTQNILLRVTPQLNAGNPNLLPQNCNAVGARVVGAETESMLGRGQRVAARTAARLAPAAWQAYKDAYYDEEQEFNENARADAIAREYVTALPNSRRALATAGANQYAKPAVGEAYMIATIGGGAPQPNGTSRVRDFASGTDRDLGWSFHFAGVVARSGTDRVTLENYARGDNRQNGADPRWYFQMYGEQAAQTFHEVNASSPNYANPVTVTVGRANDAKALHKAD
ncbi:hypothetical protein [Pseudoduganella violaceinigra]|uniref:hypothetical protein n=1 Tax=Pseudoduganella violaceinigra TaxID=246602 RepID=UPI000483B66D|nr:hypothetical protein [Pseudoduganella violaceinigra]